MNTIFNLNGPGAPVIDKPAVKPSEADPSFKSIMERMLKPANEQAPEEPPMYAVLLHNDNTTQYHFVVRVLMEGFQLSQARATQIMQATHNTGQRNVVNIVSKEVADMQMDNARMMIARANYPADHVNRGGGCELQFTLELESKATGGAGAGNGA